MLIFISDLHLMDGTSGKHHLEPETFEDIFKELARQAVDAGISKNSQTKDLKIVLLGDIFELIRTEAWFRKKEGNQVVETINLKDRPWGTPSEKTETVVLEIFEEIVSKNKEILNILSCREWQKFGFPIKPTIIYIPGNHDRLCNEYPSLRERVQDVLGLEKSSPDERFPNTFIDMNHSVFARHGHEWDPFNYEDDYVKTPIGDVIASEIASKLPIVVEKHLQNSNLSKDNIQTICNHFRHLFDVRPLTAIIPWLFYQVERSSMFGNDVQQKINSAFREVGEEFMESTFVKRWIRKNDFFWPPMDQADLIQLLGFTLRTFDISNSKWKLNLWEKVKHLNNMLNKNSYIDRIQEDFNKYNQYQFVLSGHTHHPMQQAINIRNDNEGNESVHQIYINTGTWRPAYYQTASENGFTKWNNLTYTIIYQPGEQHSGVKINKPRFEVWTGALNY